MFHPLGDFPDPGIGPLSLASPALQIDSTAEPSGTLILCWYFPSSVICQVFFFNYEKFLNF